MTRISVAVPAALKQQIQHEAMRAQMSVSDLIRRIVEKHLDKQKEIRIKRSHQALEQLIGIGNSEETDTSQRTEEIVYGLHEHADTKVDK